MQMLLIYISAKLSSFDVNSLFVVLKIVVFIFNLKSVFLNVQGYTKFIGIIF